MSSPNKTGSVSSEERRAATKKKILDLLRKVNRPGMTDLISWLEQSTFFEMPASARYHGNYEGGLAEHSLNVYEALVKLRQVYIQQFGGTEKIPIESVILCSLCHDFCKIDFYTKVLKNVKNVETGQWEQKQVYAYSNQYNMGHGEASVFLVQNYIRLSYEEILAIRWHMGAYDSAVKGGDRSISLASEQTPLVPLLHMADMWASQFMEETVA